MPCPVPLTLSFDLSAPIRRSANARSRSPPTDGVLRCRRGIPRLRRHGREGRHVRGTGGAQRAPGSRSRSITTPHSRSAAFATPTPSTVSLSLSRSVTASTTASLSNGVSGRVMAGNCCARLATHGPHRSLTSGRCAEPDGWSQGYASRSATRGGCWTSSSTVVAAAGELARPNGPRGLSVL
jgi:hypothetical protein